MVLHNRNTDQRALKMSTFFRSGSFIGSSSTTWCIGRRESEYLMTGGFEVSAAGDIVTLAFGRETMDFTEDERELLNQLRPIFSRHTRTPRQLTTVRSELECREQALEEAVNSAVVVVHNLTIKHASRSAIRWLSSFLPRRSGTESQAAGSPLRWVSFLANVSGRQTIRCPAVLPVDGGIRRGAPEHRMLTTRRPDEVLLLLSREVGQDSPESLRQLGLSRARSRSVVLESRRARPAARRRRFCRSRERPWTSMLSASTGNSASKPAPPRPQSHGPQCAILKSG